MKTKSLIVMAAAFGFAGAAYAEEGKPHPPHRNLPAEILEKFDKDGDGKLNEEERQAAKANREEMMKARKAEMLKKFDTDGDGKLSEEEEAAMKAERKKMMLEKFDKDGDGELNDEEKAEMRKAMIDRPGGHGPGKGHRKPGQGKHRPGADKPDAQAEAPGATE